ncbi:membrane protein [Pontibacillus halophilus JSM 076056 = DSM 19796]|uniref:Membrane protein n=1 Tax=Pontibacillus halophilus JSM 076056 = DSM 19796 TaxID=1385510 RepID=A0A0A5G2U9_9BACI|nr:metal-dependent hydrolase [Pontibacillus halophilus]KGX87416.1 membrane protein [Pontibacillus halophilus JSM 076056 = DSM 19796]
MDTGTHIVMGIALGGLATLDPAVQDNPALFNAIMVGTIAGSQAPDLDTVTKFKNNAVYIRNHRGITHSIPAVLFWGISIPALIFLFVPEVNFLHLWLWSFLAVILHVFVDLFNAYGTQAYRPFSERWVAWGIINTFDPYIFLFHIIGILTWMFGADPGYTFLTVYFVLFLYYVKRYLDKRQITKQVEARFPDVEQIVTSPTMRNRHFRLAITTPTHFYVGKSENGTITILDEFHKKPLPEMPVMEKAITDHHVEAFLHFSPVYRWTIVEHDHHTEVRFTDLRYRSKGRYPFVAVVTLDDDLEILSSYTGWIFSEEKLQKKLDTMPTSS